MAALPELGEVDGQVERPLETVEKRVDARVLAPILYDTARVPRRGAVAVEEPGSEDIQAIVRGMKKNNVAEFPLEHTISILLGTCAGLAYAHDKRDLDGRAVKLR